MEVLFQKQVESCSSALLRWDTSTSTGPQLISISFGSQQKGRWFLRKLATPFPIFLFEEHQLRSELCGYWS